MSRGETPAEGSAQVPERANAIAPTCGRLKGFVARGLSPNGDGHVIGYQDPPSLPSVNNCLWIITTNVIYHDHFTRTPAPPSLFRFDRSDPTQAAVSSRGGSHSNLWGCWAQFVPV